MNSILYGNRYKSPIGVCELMAFFAATHTSINALPGTPNRTSLHNKLDWHNPEEDKVCAKACTVMLVPLGCV